MPYVLIDVRSTLLFIMLIISLAINTGAVSIGDSYDVDLGVMSANYSYFGEGNETNTEKSIRDSFTMKITGIGDRISVEKFITEEVSADFTYDLLTIDQLWEMTIGISMIEMQHVIHDNISFIELAWVDPIDFTMHFGKTTTSLSYFMRSFDVDQVVDMYNYDVIVEGTETRVNYFYTNSTTLVDDQRKSLDFFIEFQMVLNTETQVIREFDYSRNIDIFDGNLSYNAFSGINVNFSINSHVESVPYPVYSILAMLFLRKRRYGNPRD